MGKFRGVFICGNGSIGYNYHKCSQRKMCRLKVEKLIKIQKMCVFEL